MRIFSATLALLLLATAAFAAWAKQQPRRRLAAFERTHPIEPLDVLFQQLPWGGTQVGIVLETPDGQRYVWETLDEVRATPLGEWVTRTDTLVSVYRFDEELQAARDDIAKHVRNQKGLTCDGSELIITAVKHATGTTLAPRRTVARLENGRLTEDPEPLVPADLASSPHLKRVKESPLSPVGERDRVRE